MRREISVIDSHTGGEPTRVVIDGLPQLKGESIEEKRIEFRDHFDWVRSTCINEPRGFDAIVGALLFESAREDGVASIMFFNNVSVLNGCVHGTIGVVETLYHLGRLAIDEEAGLETPVGIVKIKRAADGTVSVKNVRSYRYREGVEVDVPNYGKVAGDIAWGGNWFFLAEANDVVKVDYSNIDELTQFSWAIRESLKENEIAGEDGGEIDHVEIFGPAVDPGLADSKNFVLCPGKAYDRSPCGTGTSAKLACLAASGKLQPGETWRQSGILDSIFEGSYVSSGDGGIIPTISGRAFITGKATLISDPEDPFRDGIIF